MLTKSSCLVGKQFFLHAAQSTHFFLQTCVLPCTLTNSMAGIFSLFLHSERELNSRQLNCTFFRDVNSEHFTNRATRATEASYHFIYYEVNCFKPHLWWCLHLYGIDRCSNSSHRESTFEVLVVGLTYKKTDLLSTCLFGMSQLTFKAINLLVKCLIVKYGMEG